MFAQMMIPHHEQAVEMADLAPARAADPEIKELAVKIKAAQDPEIRTMKGWLTGWGKAALEGGMGHDMPGVMSEKEMTKQGGQGHGLRQAVRAADDRPPQGCDRDGPHPAGRWVEPAGQRVGGNHRDHAAGRGGGTAEDPRPALIS
ncbi:DUF305 domain-containing protein [Nonomuraea sp. KM88]|uniref:DUF305 domain-containing protein n=1 Tax=Nonomuraea sp. KM88 TaxID=3457427 RepID=UPI003FCEAD7A